MSPVEFALQLASPDLEPVSATSTSFTISTQTSSIPSSSPCHTLTPVSLLPAPPIKRVWIPDSVPDQEDLVIAEGRHAGASTVALDRGDSQMTTLSFGRQASTEKSARSHPGTSTGSIVGIAVGLTLGFLLFFGAIYIYWLWWSHQRRKRRRRRKRIRSKGSISGGGGGGGGGGDGPPPPPPVMAPANP